MIENLAAQARLPQMFAQMWAVHNLSQWYSALINDATRAAYFRSAVGITPVTGIYRGFWRESESKSERGGRERGREGKDRNARGGSREETDQRRRYLQSWLVAATQLEKRGGDARERDGIRVCTETQRKEKGRGGILGTWIDAVLSNHVLRLLLSVFHPVPLVSPLSSSHFSPPR